MDYLAILRQYDDALSWEFPPGFDYELAASRFAKFADALSKSLNVPLKTETGSSIQDASFHSQIYVPIASERFTLVRFSNFGQMATFAEEEPIPEELKQLLIQLFDDHQYTYIPAPVLNMEYTGTNHGVTGIEDWWSRFFDWV